MIKKQHKNNFNKTLLLSSVITKCDRRLFLELAKKKPELWLDPVRETIDPKRKPLTSELLKELGKVYEQQAYSRLKTLPNVKYREDVDGKIDKLKLDTSEFSQLFKYLTEHAGEDIFLLEFEYSIPKLFFKKFFPDKKDVQEIPVSY